MPIDHGVELLIEGPGEKLKPASVRSPQLAALWKPCVGKKINLSRQIKPAWIRFRLSHQATPASLWANG